MQVIVFLVFLAVVTADFWEERNKLIEFEKKQLIGSWIQLTDKEAQANEIIMRYKYHEYDAGMKDPKSFLPAQHFFISRDKIEKTHVFKIIRKFPKQTLLHGHLSALASGDFIYNLTYEKDLYACKQNNGRLKLEFFTSHPDKTCSWTLVEKWRHKDPKFDDFLKTQLSMIRKDPWNNYNDANALWQNFSDTHETLRGLIHYEPVFRKYISRVLQELYEDNIKYLEFRGTFNHVYNGRGRKYSSVEAAEIFLEQLKQFKKNHSDFINAKFIFTGELGNPDEKKYLKTVKKLKKIYPDFIIGFDLGGREDSGKPLFRFQNLVKEMQNKYGLKLFLHAGATSWYGTEADNNLIDVILLNPERITHALAVNKHPEVIKMIKKQNISIELCPISNQVMGFVRDQRNHPAISLINQNYPVVICNEDPALWGATGLSYDWYITFMGLASREMDLRFLKQLAYSSIWESSMSVLEAIDSAEVWERDWEKFLDYVIGYPTFSA